MTKQDLIEQIATSLNDTDLITVEAVARVVDRLSDNQKPRSTIVKICDFISNLF